MTVRDLINLSRDEIVERMRSGPVAVLPIGAVEQHGHHLPLGTDDILAKAIAEKVADRINGIVLPVVPFGYSWVWKDVPGTVTVQHETLERYLLDIFASVENSGFRQLVIINGHESNNTSMKYAVRDFAAQSNYPVMRFFYPKYAAIWDRICESESWYGMFHACEFETSLMLAVRPDLVDMSKAVREYPPDSPAYRHASQSLGELSSSGVFGDATKATPEKGTALFRHFVDEIVAVVEESRNWPGNRDGSGGRNDVPGGTRERV